MELETFDLERSQSQWENTVKYNLTESGIHPFTLREILGSKQLDRLLDTRLGYGHTEGLPELRDAIAALYPGATRDHVLVTSGSAEANFVAAWSLLGPGDEVVYMLPNFMQIWGLARALGATVRPFHLRESAAWAPDLDEFERRLSPRCRLIAICNPNNPTGAVLQADAIDAMVGLAHRAGVPLLADEVYRGAEFDGAETASFHGRYDRTIVVSGLAKAMAHPGLRIGWLAADPAFIEQAKRRQDYTTIGTGILNQLAAAAILEPERRAEILRRNRALLEANLAVITDWVGTHADILNFIPPKAGGMAFIRYALPINSTELSDRLRREKSVFVVPGDCFGMDNYLRIGIGSETGYLVEALALIDDFLAPLIKRKQRAET